MLHTVRLLVVIIAIVAAIAAVKAGAAQPVTITFEDIVHLPVNLDSLPAFNWQGVYFDGGALKRTTTSVGTMSWYGKSSGGSIVMQFPPGATNISFQADGFGQSILGWEFMPLQVWDGPVGSGTVIATIPPAPPPNRTYVPPSRLISVPDGGTGLITIFTAPAPSGVRQIGNAIAIDNVRYTPADPDPTFTFDLPPTSNQKVLIHKYRSNDNYPSPLQTQDRQIRIEGTVTLNGQPAAGKTIYFRLLNDPADTAPYVQNAGDAHVGDNVDAPGRLNGSNQPVTAVSDGAGRISLTLEVTDHVAGDNYQIEASPKTTFSCAPTCPKSAVYTAWKRVYVEMNKMFRRGAYITANVIPGTKEIEVSNIKAFPKPPFQVRLIHAPEVLSGTPDFYSEFVTITKTNGSGAWPFGVEPGSLFLDSDPNVQGVQRAYFAGEAVGSRSAKREYLADAVGLVTGDRMQDYFLVDATLVNKTFGEAFVEHVWLTDAVAGVDSDLAVDQPRLFFDGVLPYDPLIDDPPEGHQSEWMGRKWMRNAQRVGQDRIAEHNHHVVFAATNTPGANGFNRVGSGFNDLWMFVRQIGSPTVIAESFVHELAHEWRVNPLTQSGKSVTGGDGGHCNVPLGAYQKMYGRNFKCTMHSSMYGDPNDGERGDGIIGFHYVKIGQTTDSEYLRIRQRHEPVPQSDHQRTAPQ